jgi:hypothetical protein
MEFLKVLKVPQTHLELVKNSVAYPGHEHHRDQEGNNSLARHGVLSVKNEGR